MEQKMYKVSAKSDPKIQLKVYPGHFITPQSHITHYLDLTTMISRSSEARRVAESLASYYEITTTVDTIVCMDGMEVVGAYLAEELTKVGIFSMNSHQTIYITSPEYDQAGQMIFRDNTQLMIKNKNVLILNGSITTGKTLNRAIESILYYGGRIPGVAAIFSAVDSIAGLEIRSIYHQRDIPDYGTYQVGKCPLCQQQQKIDALVNGFGYSKI